MISEARLRAAVTKATYKGVTVQQIKTLLLLAGCARVHELPLTRRRPFIDVLGALGKMGRQP